MGAELIVHQINKAFLSGAEHQAASFKLSPRRPSSGCPEHLIRVRKSLHFHLSIFKANLKFSSRAAMESQEPVLSPLGVSLALHLGGFCKVRNRLRVISASLANFPAALLDEKVPKMFQVDHSLNH